MCGIIGIFGKHRRAQALSMAKAIRHRGPDHTGIYEDDFCTLVHERLAIMDPEHGDQPFIDKKTGRVLILNGEIYNIEELKQKLKKKHEWQSAVPDEALLYLYDEYGKEFIDWIDGMFAFILYDPKTKEYLIARDHIGIVPLYIGQDEHCTYIASEMKAIPCEHVETFRPGHYYAKDGYEKWYEKHWMTQHPEGHATHLKEHLEKSVKQQIVADVPFGVLLSGGLDSSLVAAIARQYVAELHTFSIGLQDSPDLAAARKVAAAIDSTHHEFTYTIQEGLDALSDVIRHIETFDVTSIRASTPMYLMARKIKARGFKMVLSGEGADEIFGGYLYFHMAPSAKEFWEETVRKVLALSKYDCLRANKSMMAWGVEARVPFLGKEFVDYAMQIDPEAKRCVGRIEKHLLRETFEDHLPEEILWRQKEQFSDGVGYRWIDSLKKHAEETITDRQLARAHERFPYATPQTKEAYLYREIFEQHFPSEHTAKTVPGGPSIACSTATAFEWSKQFKKMGDPTGRAVSVHKKAVQKI
ncbi:MAG: asparagine synthase B [Candidatus Woesearchaeota archaeon]|nr:asparagine synthase B [Candidatus Woesearchaeota archaeon]